MAPHGSCDSPLFTKYHCEPDSTYVVMGIVDDGKVVGSIVKPEEYIILGEKAPWWNLANDNDLAKYERFSKPGMRKTVGGGQILEMHSIGEKGAYGKDRDGSRTIYCQHINVRMRISST